MVTVLFVGTMFTDVTITLAVETFDLRTTAFAVICNYIRLMNRKQERYYLEEIGKKNF